MPTLYLLLAIVTTLSHASIYECRDAKANPEDTHASHKVVEIKKSKPRFFNNPNSPVEQELNLRPFLVFYAIDTAEPFMQYSIKYELAQLRHACEKNANVQFAAFLNSLYVGRNSFIVCKNKTYKEVELGHYRNFDARLKAKRKHLMEGDHTSGNLGPMTFLVQYKKHLNEAFGEFPLAHPDFVNDLLNLLLTEKDLFPSEKNFPFLNLKSHGNEKMVLSGLQQCQTEAKRQSQLKAMNDLLSESERALLENADFYSELSKLNPVLEKLALGTSKGLTVDASLGNAVLGNAVLGNAVLGNAVLGNTISGLGSGQGLGSDWFFGLHHTGLSAILTNLFNDTNGRFLGFVMLESCDTNRSVAFHHAFMSNVLGVYSAKNSLWYRNLNWWALLEEANGSSEKLMELLKGHTGSIENLVIKD